MDWLFKTADKYLKKCDWKDLALIKFCLFSMGLLCGLAIPAKGRGVAKTCAVAVFTATYLPLMAKFFSIALDEE